MSRHHLDAYAAVERARSELASFLRSSFRFLDPSLDKSVHRLIDQFGLLAPSVAEATFPYEEASEGPRTTKDLAEAGILHGELVELLAQAKGEAAWPSTRPLYRHQVDALRDYHDGRSIVVASGTGSGKTECFLLPAIDMVLKDSDLARPGVRVLIVYPLNALVNNQMDRLRALLGHHKHIRFALYTRRLAQTERIARRRLERSGEHRYPAEIISREELRRSPPHILVTNFSMLEYALVRPADAPLFSDDFVKPRLVVLDEAHVYSGSMAAEITLLLRRAWLRWGLDPHSVQGIVTSATMHQGVPEGRERLKEFAADILSKDRGAVSPIEGSRELDANQGIAVESPLPDPAVLAELNTDFRTLEVRTLDDGSTETVFHASTASDEAAAHIVACLRPGFEGVAAAPALYLWNALEPLVWVRHLRRTLHEERLTVDGIAISLFGEGAAAHDILRRRAVHKLLEILSFARPSPSGLPLLPVRLHAIMRGPHGIFACVSPTCTHAPVASKRLGALNSDPVDRCPCGAFVCELRLCEGCGQSYLLAEQGVNEDGMPAFKHFGPSSAKLLVPGRIWDDGAPLEPEATVSVLPDGRIVEPTAGGAVLTFAMFSGGRLVGPTRQLVGVPCPRCELHRPDGAVIRKIESGTDAALQVIIEGVYPALPEHAGAMRETLPAGGRRALLFADNRQIAASLAAKVEESHDILLARAILVDALKDTATVSTSPREEELMRALMVAKRKKDASLEAELNAELDREIEAAKAPTSASFSEVVRAVSNHPALRETSTWQSDLEQDLGKFIVARELGRRPARGGNLEASGIAIVDYVLELPAPSDPDVMRAFPGDAWRSLVGVVLDTLRTSGAVELPVMAEAYEEHLVRERYGKAVVRSGRAWEDEEEEGDESRGGHVPLMPATSRGTRRTAWLERVLARANVPARVTPMLVLEEVWKALVAVARVEGSSFKLRDQSLLMPLALLRFREGLNASRWQCPRCRTVWTRQVANVCPTRHCNGILEALPADYVDVRDRVSAALRDRKDHPLLGLTTEEHTAQIGVLKLAEIERDFKAGRRNVLVSSTTMELGIDIGGLSATILTNVPPGPSNYLQRAGRAGRRAEGTSLVLTFARPRPFDQAVFQQPDKPFRDRIVPPTVTLDSRRIVQRHANAYLLANFFRRYHAHADARDPMSSLRTAGEFFDSPLDAVFPGLGEKLFKSLAVNSKEHTLVDAFVMWLEELAQADGPLVESVKALLRGTTLSGADIAAVAKRAIEKILWIRDNVSGQLAFLREERRVEESRPAAERDQGALIAIGIQEVDLLNEKLLGYLAEEQFLPRYGFPVQVVPLEHSWRKQKDGDGRIIPEDDDTGLRLTRDISLAINEYAPGAEIIAAKQIHASRGILRHWTGADAPGVLASRYVAVCPSCGQMQYARTKGEVKRPCPTCQSDEPRVVPVIFPKNGFAVKWGERPRRWAAGARTPLRPVTEASYAARRGEVVSQVSTALGIAYDEEGQLLVRTEGDLEPTMEATSTSNGVAGGRAGYGYAICYRCGRAEPETAHAPAAGREDKLPKALRRHHRLRGYQPCGAEHEYWRHMALAGGVRTETLRLELCGPAEPSPENARRFGVTWLVALQLSAGEILGIDSRSFGGLLEPRPGAHGVAYDAVLYDQMAGGAGYCRALLPRWKELLDAVRRRLACENPQCTNGCHRCLIAFETQRYEEHLRRSALAAFLDDKWEVLKQQALRDGVAVSPLYRGGADVRERLARASTARVVVTANAIGDGALQEDGWLRALLRHVDRGGRVDLLLAAIPSPDEDSGRFAAERLRLAIADGRFTVRRANAKATSGFGWRIIIPDAEVPHALYVDPTGEDDSAGMSLSPEWLVGGVHEAEASAVPGLIERAEALVAAANLVTVAELTPKPPPPTIAVHSVAEGEEGSRATFDHWLKGPGGRPLFEKPVEELTIVDPFLATVWQLSLLSEVVQLAKKAGCATFKVETYPPDPEKEGYGPGVHRTVTAAEQLQTVQKVLNQSKWAPQPDPGRGKRKHKRLLVGVRKDGTRFEVLLERGLDFITEKRVAGTFRRTTRETFLTVRDPA